MADDIYGGATAAYAPTDPTLFSAWIVDTLGRPLVIVALRHEEEGNPLADLRAQLRAYPSVRLLVEVVADATDTAALSRIAALEPDTLLVCEDARDPDGAPTAGAWRTAILDAAEGLNLFDRMLIAWRGVGVTRASARAAGYEDGFTPEQPLADVLAILAREAITRASYRRQGSSPPCYL